MYRYFFRFVITTLTILAANLITTSLSDFMISYRDSYKPLAFTLTGMGIILVVFYPLFIKLEIWIKSISLRMVRSGNSLAGKYIGLTLTFVLSLVVLSYFYARMWYHIDLFRILVNGKIGEYI